MWYRDTVEDSAPAPAIDLQLKAWFRRGTLISWDELFVAACGTADNFQLEQVVSFSHSDSKGNGIAVVWYWDAAAPEEPQP